ncbi:MAG: flagellar motor switch protein FliM [Actinomycetota bacterium]|nr:flagellar motor switch protein FliM [Actinomycetota bacterium]
MSQGAATGAALRANTSSPVVVDVAARARPFDLRRQETIERARLRSLQPMLESVGHRIGSSLTLSLRQPVRAELGGLDQLSWEDYSSQLPEPTFLSTAVFLPHEGRAILHLPVQLTFLAIDYYLGGDGLVQPQRDGLTDIERTVIGGLVDDVWKEIPQPFATFAPLNPAMITTANSSLLIQVGSPSALYLVVRINLTVGDHDPKEIQLCLPAALVLSLIEQLERHQSNGTNGGMDRRQTRRRLLSAPVELKVAFPPLALTPSELLSLQVGDVVHIGQIDQNLPQELDLTVEDVVYGTGVIVENGKRLACTILTKKEDVDER